MNWLDDLLKTAKTGAEIYGSVRDADLNETLAERATEPATEQKTPAWLWPVGIGAAALLLLVAGIALIRGR